MTKKCECCGKTISYLDLQMPLWEGKVLCSDCAGDIRRDVDNLYATTPEELKTKKEAIVQKCNGRFGEDVIRLIIKRIDYKFESLSGENNRKDNGENDKSEYYTTGGMFCNIGEKIKALAQIITWIGIIVCVVLGIIIIANDDELVLIGLLVMVLGSLLSWVSSFVLYGFGQLIENSDKIVKKMEK